MEVPTAAKVQGMDPPPAQPCTVVEVNQAKGWYRVRFLSTGLHECYKIGGAGR